MIKGVGGRKGMIGTWDAGDVGEEGLVKIGVAGDVRSGRRLGIAHSSLETVEEEVGGGESPWLGGRSLVGEHLLLRRWVWLMWEKGCGLGGGFVSLQRNVKSRLKLDVGEIGERGGGRARAWGRESVLMVDMRGCFRTVRGEK